MITVNTLFNDLNRLVHKGTLTQTSDIFGATWQGVRNMISKCQPPELERQQFIEQALYNRVNRYITPIDLDGNKVISMKLLQSRTNVGNWTNPLQQVFSEDFGMTGGIDSYSGWGDWHNDQHNRGGFYPRNKLTVLYENSVKYVELPDISSPETQIINKEETLTENGTWNTFGCLVNLREDKLQYLTGNSSLMFDFDSSSTNGAMENFTMTPVDLTEYINIGALFNWLNLSVFQDIISVKLIWASSLSDWYEHTVTAPHDNNQFTNGWNLLKFSFQDTTQVGTPNPANINRIRVEFVTTGQAQVNCHLTNLIARKGKVYSVNYYTSFFFRDPLTNNYKEQPTSGNDIINLEQDAYNILLYETADALTQETTGNYKASPGLATADHFQFRKILDDLPNRAGDTGGLYWQFNHKYPSKIINPTQDAYHFINGHL